MDENMSLFQVAFGGLTLAAIGFLVVVAEKLGKRDLKAEAELKEALRKGLSETSAAAAAFRREYVYDDPAALKLCAKLRRMPRSLALGYVVALLVLLSTDRHVVAAVKPLAKVADYLDGVSILPHHVAMLFTVFVVVQVWLHCGRYVAWLNKDRPEP